MNENNQNNNEISSEVEKNLTLRVTSPHDWDPKSLMEQS